ncbi:LnmK family bifunctional acyltransferase/decarboxylase [Chitinophagaceae bacterium MMS25-I14]
MEQYIAVLKDAAPGITYDDLHTPLSAMGLHSLDHIIMRSTLEEHFGFPVTDEDWNYHATLAGILQHCRQKKEQLKTQFLQQANLSLCKEEEIRLPQMANGALSEHWLLKETGDIHWQLLGRGLEQKSSAITDHAGDRLYATFVRVSYTTSPLCAFRENEHIQFHSAISRFGSNIYHSITDGVCGDKYIKANLITSFSARRKNDNDCLVPAKPATAINHINIMENIPRQYAEHRLLSKEKISSISSDDYMFSITSQSLHSITHFINPYIDINGAGLLYFASYPLIADHCTSVFFRLMLGMKDYDRLYHTIYRDVFYFGNCNADDSITVQLNSMEHIEDDKIKTTSSLYRQSDGKLIGKIFTVKQKMM